MSSQKLTQKSLNEVSTNRAKKVSARDEFLLVEIEECLETNENSSEKNTLQQKFSLNMNKENL